MASDHSTSPDKDLPEEEVAGPDALDFYTGRDADDEGNYYISPILETPEEVQAFLDSLKS